MKKFTTLLLIGALVAWPVQKPRAQLAGAVCLVIVAAAAVGGVAVIIKSCRPRYYCVEDSETGMRWCRVMDRADLVENTLKIISGPYKDESRCTAICTNATPKIAEAAPILHIEKSTDLVVWTECAAIPFDGVVFEWSELNREDTACYYRAYATQ